MTIMQEELVGLILSVNGYSLSFLDAVLAESYRTIKLLKYNCEGKNHGETIYTANKQVALVLSLV